MPDLEERQADDERDYGRGEYLGVREGRVTPVMSRDTHRQLVALSGHARWLSLGAHARLVRQSHRVELV